MENKQITKAEHTSRERSTEQTGGIPFWFNRAIGWLLRSPLHELLSGSVMLITFTGRKSSKSYTTPISYSRQEGQIIAFTHSPWWKNLRGGAPVLLYLHGKEVQGQAEIVTNEPVTILPYLRAHLQQVARDARFYGVKLDAQGQPNEADLAKAAQQSTLIQITLRHELGKEHTYGMA